MTMPSYTLQGTVFSRIGKWCFDLAILSAINLAVSAVVAFFRAFHLLPAHLPFPGYAAWSVAFFAVAAGLAVVTMLIDIVMEDRNLRRLHAPTTAPAETDAPAAPVEGGGSELLPCPFCGGEAEIIHLDDGDNAGGSCVCCTRCQASGNVEFGRKENFVENWNRRAALRPQPSGDVREAVSEAEWRDAVALILPLAKGYAAAHPVGSNQSYVDYVEDLLSARPAPVAGEGEQ